MNNGLKYQYMTDLLFEQNLDKNFLKNHEDISKLIDQLWLHSSELESISFLTFKKKKKRRHTHTHTTPQKQQNNL